MAKGYSVNVVTLKFSKKEFEIICINIILKNFDIVILKLLYEHAILMARGRSI